MAAAAQRPKGQPRVRVVDAPSRGPSARAWGAEVRTRSPGPPGQGCPLALGAPDLRRQRLSVAAVGTVLRESDRGLALVPTDVPSRIAAEDALRLLALCEEMAVTVTLPGHAPEQHPACRRVCCTEYFKRLGCSAKLATSCMTELFVIHFSRGLYAPLATTSL